MRQDAEASERSLAAVLGALLIPVFVLLVMPWVRPLSAARLVFTYLIPLLPVVIFWDGMVSCLRTRGVAELQALTAGIDASYVWQAGHTRRLGRTLTYLAGWPGGLRRCRDATGSRGQIRSIDEDASKERGGCSLGE